MRALPVALGGLRLRTSKKSFFLPRRSLQHQFGIEDGGAGSASDGVVAQHDVFEVEHGAGAQAAHSDAHSLAGFYIQAGLGPIGLVSDQHRTARS